jgi:hypothetical protein
MCSAHIARDLCHHVYDPAMIEKVHKAEDKLLEGFPSRVTHKPHHNNNSSASRSSNWWFIHLNDGTSPVPGHRVHGGDIAPH